MHATLKTKTGHQKKIMGAGFQEKCSSLCMQHSYTYFVYSSQGWLVVGQQQKLLVASLKVCYY
jgi:hypothetical protein